MNEKFRLMLDRAETAYGLWVTSEASSTTEIAGVLGLDWICVDMEHGYLDHRDLQGHLKAAKGTDLTVLVRPPAQDVEHIKRAIEAGAHGVVLPLINTADEVRAARHHVRDANKDVLCVPMIETRAGYENLDDIMAVEGVEAIFLGPRDLSASRGAIGDWEGPGVAEINLDVLQRVRDRGIHAGIVARGADEAVLRRDQGFGMVALGSDVGLLIRLIRSMTQALDRDTQHEFNRQLLTS